MVVHDHGQVIGKQAIATVDNKILARQTFIGMNVARELIVKCVTGECCTRRTAAFSGP
jgi:hypothetical protein